ncbi:hypothetical protein J2W28_000671 [Variovorax boronicumulans]|uniref:hypothetical protein n=1 Tax=Variovorax boronicumulans TaxID=436515 RepID=UPI0027872D4B|nr:hypothetical protein [Variovorax boronicumulans]MDP9989950.1 hypothetical protein [Variovorax boronicumulans]MDQ0001543.1 hypothetical protein [Variovorax boronicumulans]
MRQFQTRQQQQHQQPVQEPVRPSAHVPARGVTAQDVENETLDRAAALWTTRRIRSFFLLLDQPLRAAQR